MKKIYLILLCCLGTLLASSHAQGVADVVQVERLGLGTLEGVAYSPDGRTLYSYGGRGIIVRDAATGEVQRIIESDVKVSELSISPDGRYLAAASYDDIVKLWNAATGELLHTLQGHTSGVTSLAYSPDGQILASGSSDDSIKLWNAATGELLRTLQGHTNDVESLAYSPDGQILASGSDDETIKLWNAATGELIRTLQGHTAGVYSLAYSPDGQMLASGSQDDTIKLWNAATGELLRTLQEHTSGVRSLAYSPDGQILASGSYRTIKLWNAATGELLRTLQEHTDSVYSLAYSPDGQILASGSYRTIKLWNAATGELLRTLQGHTGFVTSLAYSPDGQILTSGSYDDTIKLWNAATGELLRTLQGHTGWVTSLAYSPDGQILASGSWDETIKLWNATGELLRTLQEHTDSVYSLAYSPDGQILASGSNDKTIKLWNATGELIRTLQGHTNTVSSLAYSPDGQILASGSYDNTIKLWDAATGELLRTLQGHTDSVTSLAYSPDGQILASGSHDKTIKLWNATGELLRTLQGHTGFVTSLAYSPDGQILASGSGLRDDTIKLWNAATGELLRTLQVHTDSVTSLAYSPDGRLLSSGGGDGVVRVWATPNRSAVFCPSGSCSTPSLSAPQLAILSPSNGSQLSSSHLQLQLANNGGAAENYRVQAAGRSLTLALTSKNIGVAASDTVYLDVTIPNDLQGQRFDVLVEASNSAGSDSESVALSLLPASADYSLSITSPWHNRQIFQPQLAISLDLSPRPSQEPDWQLSINGNPITINTRDIGISASNAQEYTLNTTIPNTIASNTPVHIEVQALLAGTVIASDSVQVSYAYVAPSLPKLYILAIGVDDYQHSSIDRLDFAVKDATTFADLFHSQAGKLYAEVIPLVLTNEKATSTQVRSALGRLINTVEPTDVVMVFFSGHGVKAAVGNEEQYYVVLHNTDTRDYEGTALPQRDLKHFVGRVQGDVFMFIDTCHSGMPGKATAEASAPDAMIRDIAVQRDDPTQGRRDRIIEIFAASQGNEYAQEDASWGHGAFTKAIVEGIEGGRALGYEGVVTNLRLFEWIDVRVRELTNGQQHPHRDGEGGSYVLWQP